MSLNYIGPMIMEFGTPKQQERFLKPMAAGETIWCQGFSEPGAGSDLAAISTQARMMARDFSSTVRRFGPAMPPRQTGACCCAGPTRRDRKHQGLSMLLVDMNTPGVTVRPIDSMGGQKEFNEVFFDNARVPYECLLGPRGDGWNVAISALAYERVGAAIFMRVKLIFDMLVEHVKTTKDKNGEPLSKRATVRSGLVRLYARYRAAKLLCYRVVAAMDAGDNNPGLPCCEQGLLR